MLSLYCVTLDFDHQISLVNDLVLQLTIALQLKGDVLRVLHVVYIACIILYIMCNLVTRSKDMLDTSYDTLI